MNNNYIFILLAHFTFVFVFIKIFFCTAPCFLVCFVNNAVTIFSSFVLSWYTFKFTKEKWLNEKIQPDGKAVFITGCDSGFGKTLAARLDSKGFHVFASCLFPSGPGATELKKKCSDRLQILELDVTKDQSVQDAVKFVKENLGTSELWALVNNAGIHKGFNVEFTSMQDFKDCIEVNTYGPVRVTKAFLPLLRQSKGRIINMTSAIGRFVLPNFTPYIMSKFAAVGFTDCLRQELDIWGVKVISVEPEIFQTGLTDKEDVPRRLQKTLDELDESIKSDYGKDFMKSLQKFQKIFINYASPKIEIVVDNIESAILSQHPDIIYTPRRNILFRVFIHIFQISPSVIQDLIVKVMFCFANLLPD